MAASILDLLNVPPELTLEFLASFARFEFALKRAGYALGDDTKVMPDRDSFARDVAQLGTDRYLAFNKPIADDKFLPRIRDCISNLRAQEWKEAL